MKALIFILGLLSFSCSPTTEKAKEQTFVAINLQTVEEDFKEKYKNLSADEILPPPPPIVYYSKHNFIIDDEGGLYYFIRKDKGYRYCGTGITYNRKPEFLNLSPSELVKVPEDSISSVVKKIRPEYGKLFISFSSVRDTFQSPGLSRLLKLYDKNQSLTAYSLRTSTAEEKVVLEHKKNGMPYDPKKIKWDPADFDTEKLPIR